MQSLTLIQKIEKFENIGAEMVRDGLDKTKLFSDISSTKIIKADRLSIIKLLLVKFPLSPKIIMFYKQFLNLQRLIRQTKEMQRCLTS